MTSGLGGLAPFFRRFLPLLNGYTPFFQPFFGHFWPPVNGFLPSPSGWACSDFTERVWVQPPFRGHQLATFMMHELETFARERGYKRTVLMTRERMDYAIKLYEGLGYKRIENYPPYQHMDDAVCYAKDLPTISLTV